MSKLDSCAGTPILRATALALLLLLPACGDHRTSGPAAAGAPARDDLESQGARQPDLSKVKACGLLTAAEIEAATGIAVGRSEDLFRAERHPPHCQWWPGADPGPRPLADLMVVRGLTYSSYEDFVDTTRRQMAEMQMEFDEAHWQHVPQVAEGLGIWLPELGMIQVYSNGWMVQVDTQTAAGKDPLEASRELATIALARMR